MKVCLQLVPHFTFLKIFSRSCSGCIIFQFYALAALHPSLDLEVRSLLKALLFDEQEIIKNPKLREIFRLSYRLETI